MAGPQRLSLLCCLLLITTVQLGQAKLVLVYSVQRHGARNVLPKTALLSEPDTNGGATLLPQGERQTQLAGAAFRTRYLDPATCGTTCLDNNGLGQLYGAVGLSNVGYTAHDVNMRSSYLDRTLLSAQCFLQGMFPPTAPPTNGLGLTTGAQVIPVYSEPDTQDIVIRAYTKCPKYDSALLQFYISPEFVKKSADSADLRNYLASLVPGLDTSLKNFWNVYDPWNVYRTYGAGDVYPTLNDTTWSQVVSLANWLETAKMRSSLTSNLLSGPLIADMLASIDASIQGSEQSQKYYYKLISRSAHYNTQLALLGAFKVDAEPDATTNIPWLTQIPKTASVLALELHTTTNAASPYAVRLVGSDGGVGPYTTIPLPCSVSSGGSGQGTGAGTGPGLGPGSCFLTAFKAMAQPLAMTSGQWCANCSNTQVPVCVQQSLLAQLASANGAEGSSSDRYCYVPFMAAMIALSAVLFLALVAAVLYSLRQHRIATRAQYALGDEHAQSSAKAAAIGKSAA